MKPKQENSKTKATRRKRVNTTQDQKPLKPGENNVF